MPNGLAELIDHVITYMPHLSAPQATVLALWSYAIVITRCCGQTTVSMFLAMLLHKKPNTIRQQLREWCYESAAKRGNKRREIDVSTCFAPLLAWILTLWVGDHIALAIDATNLGSRFVVLAVCVVYRGGAIPVAWKIIPAYEKGSWRPHWLALLEKVKEQMPDHMTVLVLSDRGLYARWLYTAIRNHRWHPFMRVNSGAKFRPKGTKSWVWLKEFVPQVGRSWRGQGTAFSTRNSRLKCTLLAYWAEGCKDPWFILTDLPPEECDTCWYILRGWIEQGFKCTKRGGWQWNHTRTTDAKRAERLWLAMAIATLWVTCVGSQLEEAYEDNESLIHWMEELPVETAHQAYRTIRIFRLGQLWILACLANFQSLPMPVKLMPEPWPNMNNYLENYNFQRTKIDSG